MKGGPYERDEQEYQENEISDGQVCSVRNDFAFNYTG